MIYKERYKVELEDIGRENKIDNKKNRYDYGGYCWFSFR